METTNKSQKLIPTPPSSAKPKSNSRSSSIKRKFKVTKTNDNHIDSSTPQPSFQGASIAEPFTRQVSFSMYDVIPPINNDKQHSDFDLTQRNADELKTIANTGVQLERALYRKGDIFRRDKRYISKGSENHTSKLRPRDDLPPFKNPSEPETTEKERISVAFRCPDGERLCRYFMPSDRVGDILVYLRGALNKDLEIGRLSLFTSEVPTRKLIYLNATLTDSGIEDRMILNVIIEDAT